MTDLLGDAVEWLEGKRREDMTRTVVYARGEATVSILATKGRRQFQVMSDENVMTDVVTTDWIVTVADLIIPGVGATLPKRNDTITETIGGRTFVYRVLPPMAGDVEWQYSDDMHIAARVHTKMVSNAVD